MKSTGKLKMAMLAIIVIVLSCGTANAQRWLGIIVRIVW